MKEIRASRLPCLSLGLGDDRRGMTVSGNVSLTIFIASLSDSKSLTSFTNCFFYFRRPTGLRLGLTRLKIWLHSVSESSNRGKRKGQVFLCRRTVRVEVKSKVIPTSFLKIEGERLLERKFGKRGTVSRIGS